MIAPDIMRFEISKVARDIEAVLAKQSYEEKNIKARMYRKGYVPVLDIVPFTISNYNADKQVFEYTVVIYGAKCDEKIEEYEGWLSGQWIPSSMQTKSERLLSHSE
jgi:hypothetical protein